MVLEGLRSRVQPYVERLARPFLPWRPDRLSYLALGLMIAAALFAALVRWTTPYLFLPVAILVFASGVFDVLDGEVARRTHRTSPRGDFVDHVVDRYADLVIVGGIALSSYVHPLLALGALVSLQLTSYMGTQAQAVGLGRLYSGLLTRADRLMLIAAAAFLEFDWSLPWPWAPAAPWSRFAGFGTTFSVLDVLMVYFVIAGQITAVARAHTVYRRLSSTPTSSADARSDSMVEPPAHR